jgi:hypothetical protein
VASFLQHLEVRAAHLAVILATRFIIDGAILLQEYMIPVVVKAYLIPDRAILRDVCELDVRCQFAPAVCFQIDLIIDPYRPSGSSTLR